MEEIIEQTMAQWHCHDEFSNIRFLDSSHKIKDLIQYAVNLKCNGIAITDHENLCGHIDALQYVKEEKEKGNIPQEFILCLGNEIYLVDDVKHYINDDGENEWYSTSDFYHFILLAKDEIGHRQLRQLSTIAWSNNYYTGLMERVPLPKSELKRIIGENKGHIIATTACLGSELGKTLLAIKSNMDQIEDKSDMKFTQIELDSISSYGVDEALPFGDDDYYKSEVNRLTNRLNNYIDFCIDLFGDDFYFEMQPGLTAQQKYVNTVIVNELASKYNKKFIITNDVHYLSQDMANVHEALLNSREDNQREVKEFYESCWMMDCEEIHRRMDDYLGKDIVDLAIDNTNSICSKIEQYDLFKKQSVPKSVIPKYEAEESFANYYEVCPYIEKFAHSDNPYDRYFLHLVEQGWWDKEYTELLTKEKIHEMMERINVECEAIWETSVKIEDNVSCYYLSALELINMMWDDSEDGGGSLVGPSRGSIACFYTAYLMGIQQVNPLLHNIPYWRHLK